MTTGEWSCLISFARDLPTCKEGKQAKNSKWKYMSPPCIEPVTLWFLAGHLDRLTIETVDYLCFKLFQCREMTGNAWGVSKHVTIQPWLYMDCNRISYKICISFTNVDVIYYCLHLNFNTSISCIATCLETPQTLPVTSLYCKTKRRRSDPVLWQKPLYQQKCQRRKVTTQTTPQKSSIKQQLRADLGRSVGVTTATQLVLLTGLWAHLPTPRNNRVIKRTHI